MNSLERESTLASSKLKKLAPLTPLSSKKRIDMVTQIEDQIDSPKHLTDQLFNKNEKKLENPMYDEKIIQSCMNEQLMTIQNGLSIEKQAIDVLKLADENKAKANMLLKEEVKKEKPKKKKLKIKKEKLAKNKCEAECDGGSEAHECDSSVNKVVRIKKFINTEEMPANTIDYIWDVNRLNLLLEDATECLGSIKEETFDVKRLEAKKNNLGAVKFRLKDTEFKHKEPEVDSTDFNDSSKELDFNKSKKPLQPKEIKKSSTFKIKKHDDGDESINLVDEFENQAASGNNSNTESPIAY